MKLLAINHSEKLSQQTVESKFMAVQCLLMGQRNQRLVSSRAAFFSLFKPSGNVYVQSEIKQHIDLHVCILVN